MINITFIEDDKRRVWIIHAENIAKAKSAEWDAVSNAFNAAEAMLESINAARIKVHSGGNNTLQGYTIWLKRNNKTTRTITEWLYNWAVMMSVNTDDTVHVSRF